MTEETGSERAVAAAPAERGAESSGDSRAAGAPQPHELEAALPFIFFTPLPEHRSGADNKAGALLTICGLMFTVLANAASSLTEVLKGGGALQATAVVLLAGFVLLSLGTAVQAFRTISPRFFKTTPSLAFFGDIAKLSREEYIQRVEALTQEEAIEHMAAYNHTLACICVEKFRQLWLGVKLFRGAFACWLLLMALLNLRGAF